MVKLISIPVIILIYATVILYLNRNKNYNLIFKKVIFNSLIIPLIFVFSISNILLSDNQMATIGFKKSELELGLFSMSLFIVMYLYMAVSVFMPMFMSMYMSMSMSMSMCMYMSMSMPMSMSMVYANV